MYYLTLIKSLFKQSGHVILDLPYTVGLLTKRVDKKRVDPANGSVTVLTPGRALRRARWAAQIAQNQADKLAKDPGYRPGTHNVPPAFSDAEVAKATIPAGPKPVEYGESSPDGTKTAVENAEAFPARTAPEAVSPIEYLPKFEAFISAYADLCREHQIMVGATDDDDYMPATYVWTASDAEIEEHVKFLREHLRPGLSTQLPKGDNV